MRLIGTSIEEAPKRVPPSLQKVIQVQKRGPLEDSGRHQQDWRQEGRSALESRSGCVLGLVCSEPSVKPGVFGVGGRETGRVSLLESIGYAQAVAPILH